LIEYLTQRGRSEVQVVKFTVKINNLERAVEFTIKLQNCLFKFNKNIRARILAISIIKRFAIDLLAFN